MLVTQQNPYIEVLLPISETIFRRETNLVQNKKLHKNFSSKGHQLDACSFTCRKYGCYQKQHTLLHENKTNKLVSNRLESSNSKKSPSTFLQIMPATLINGKMSVKINVLLDTRSDSLRNRSRDLFS